MTSNTWGIENSKHLTMGALSKLFKRKKKSFRAYCDLTRQPLEQGATYCLTTAEIISSKRFWDNKMTEPETMTYSEMHFQNNKTGTQMRAIIFDKYSKEDKPWLIGEDQVHQFDVDLDTALVRGNEWLASEGKVVPDETSDSLAALASDSFREIKDYAVLEAGRARVAISL